MNSKELYENFHKALNEHENNSDNIVLKKHFELVCKMVLSEAKGSNDAMVHLAAAQALKWTGRNEIPWYKLKAHLLVFLENLKDTDKEGLEWKNWAYRILCDINEAEYNFLDAAKYRELYNQTDEDYMGYDNKIIEYFLKAGCEYAIEYLERQKKLPEYKTSEDVKSFIDKKLEYVLDKQKRGYVYKPRNKKLVYKKPVIVLRKIYLKLLKTA